MPDDRLREELLEAWQTNNRINLYLLKHIDAAGLRCSLSARGGRDVARQFAHVHNNRIWQLTHRAKDLAEGLETFATKVTPTKRALTKNLNASADAVGQFLSDLMDGRPRRRGFRKGIFTTLSYFVAHESHHRGSVLLTLKQSGHPVPKAVRDTIWGWDQR